MSKWIDFVEIKDTGKTKVFEVQTKDENWVCLGEIKWYPSWRKYSFFPSSDCVFETQCLSDIIAFINELMQKRNEERAMLTMKKIQDA